MTLIKYPKSVQPSLLTILKRMMCIPDFDQFSLAGGTSLALQLGHRTSVDIDLFSVSKFDSNSLQISLKKNFPSIEIVNRTHGSLCVFFEGIKIDMLHHPFPLLEKIQTENEFRVYSLRDVSAMKINAVTNRGAKKDFVDLYVLHQSGISLEQSISNFCIKYKSIMEINFSP